MKNSKTTNLILYKYVHFLVITSLFCHISAYADIGFYKTDDKTIPKAVQKSAASVYQIRITSPNKYVELDLTTPSSKAALDKIINDDTTMDNLDRIIINNIVARCVREKEEKECEIPTQISRASAFAMNLHKSSLVWTNAHVVNSLYELTRKFSSTTTGNEKADKIFRELQENRAFLAYDHMYLFDAKGQLVFSSGDEKEHALIFEPHNSVSSMYITSLYNTDTDYVFIDVPKKISRNAHRLAKKSPVDGDKVYVAGYPYCTACTPLNLKDLDAHSFKARSNNKNSDGQSMYISIGCVLNKHDVVLKKSGLQDANRFEKSALIFYDADSHLGFSGGPIFNESGEVVGIHAGGEFIDDISDNRRSRGVDLVHAIKLRKQEHEDKKNRQK